MPRVLPSIAILCAAAGIACGGPSQGAHARSPEAGGGRVAEAELPSRVLRVPGGEEVPWQRFVAELADADAVCLGEEHPNPHHHWAQLRVVNALARGDGEVALGMEMVQRPFQGVLDDYAAGRIDEAALLSRTGWERRWGYDYGLYRPMVEATAREGGDLLALNAPRELVKKVSHDGLAALTPAERARLPELDLGDPEHRAWFRAAMEEIGAAHGHGGDGTASPEDSSGTSAGGDEQHGGEGASSAPDGEVAPTSERFYAAQVVWDETMAETAADWLADGDDRRVVILAGNGHCHDSAIVSRIERRGEFEAVSVRPIIDTGDGRVADILAEPKNDYLIVMAVPGA